MDEISRLARPDIYAMAPYSSARTEGPQGNFVLLDANENPYPPYPAGDEQEGLNRYPEPQPRALVERFAEIFATSADTLFLSRGADESIDLLLRAFCAAGQDSILITPPTFVMYETAAQIQGAHVSRVALTKDFQLDVDAMLAVEPTPKLVFVCSPNNPTGNLLHDEDILRLADELLGTALVVVDHIYIDFSGRAPLTTQLDAHPNLVILRSLSKEYSLTGERLGITIGHPETIRILKRIMAPYSLTTTAIRSVTTAMSDEGLAQGRQNIQTIVAERQRMAAALQGSGSIIRVFPSDANFLLVETTDATAFTDRLVQAGIKVRDRSAAVANTVRISIGTPAENDALLAAL